MFDWDAQLSLDDLWTRLKPGVSTKRAGRADRPRLSEVEQSVGVQRSIAIATGWATIAFARRFSFCSQRAVIGSRRQRFTFLLIALAASIHRLCYDTNETGHSRR